jgi:putative cell wall-binding protein
MAAAAAVVAVAVAVGGALPAGGVETDGPGTGLGGASGAVGTWADAPRGAASTATDDTAGQALDATAPQSLAAPAPSPADASTGTITGDVSYAATDELPQRPGNAILVELARLVAETGAFESVTASFGPTFRFEGLEPGQYRLHFVDKGSQDVRNEYWNDQLYESDADVITLAPGQTVARVDASLDQWGIYTYRYGGATRYDVAALISTLAFEPGVPVVYIASGEKFPDALSAGPAAARQDGALLLTASRSLPEPTREAIVTLEPQKIVVVGGEASVSAGVYAQLSALQPNIQRISGADRYEVSRNVIDYAFCDQVTGDCPDGAKTVFAASGANFPDALSAGPAAAHVDGAVLLVPSGEWRVDYPTQVLLHRLGTNQIYVVGGPASVSESVLMDLVGAIQGQGGGSRIGGADRYEVSANVNAQIFTTGETAMLASGSVFADALSGGPVAATIDAPLFLAQRDCFPGSVWDGIRHYDPVDLLLLGGPNTLSDSVLNVEYLCG